MEERRSRTGVIICVAIVTLAILAGVGIYQFKRANDLELVVTNQYTHAFHEMTDYVKDVDYLLKKSMLASGPAQMSAISSEIYMQTAAAKANLALLPLSGSDLSATSKFLSQVGDYTSYLATKVINEGVITESEYEMLGKLSDYAQEISGQLENLEMQLNAGQLSFEEGKKSIMAAYASNEISFDSGMESIEKSFQDYPSLIYDGPFSEHIENLRPVMLEGRPEYSREEAHKVAADFLGSERGQRLAFSDEGGGTLPAYNFVGQLDEKRTVNISVTKRGGYVLYMLDNRSVTEKALSVAEATEKAREFLRRQGIFYVESSYYEESDNVATLNFAALQGDITLYSDLIKVKVALDNGEVVGYEAKGYLMSHKIREMPEEMLTIEEAKQAVSSHLIVEETGLALIPQESMREVLCYEFKGKYKDNHFLIYVNAQTGQEETILMLIESESGILTV